MGGPKIPFDEDGGGYLGAYTPSNDFVDEMSGTSPSSVASMHGVRRVTITASCTSTQLGQFMQRVVEAANLLNMSGDCEEVGFNVK